MKRHPALQQLSRDHHHALVVAQRLKRVDYTNAEDAQTTFLEYWEKRGRDHFREEEEILLPTLAQFEERESPIVATVLSDHARIGRLAAGISVELRLEQVRLLGLELEQHIRREERELFPLMERTIPEHELTRLASRLDPGTECGSELAVNRYSIPKGAGRRRGSGPSGSH